MIPFDHPNYQYPFNLEDRIKYKLNRLKSIINRDIDYKTIKGNNGTFMKEKNLPTYQIEFSNNKYTEEAKSELEKEGFKLEKNKWILKIE